MLTYTFEQRGNVPLYEYLYEKMKEDILNHRLTAGEKLSSKRAFAKNLNLSVMTVESAYAQLQVEGYIYSIEKRGYYVSDIASQVQFSQNRPYQITETPIADEYFADFISSSISREYFPFSIWAKLMRRVLTEADENLLNSSPAQGVSLLRNAIADYLFHFRGMQVSPEQIIVGAGTEYLYGLLIQLLGRDKIYGVENPGYQKVAKIYARNDVKFRYLDLDESGLSVEALSHSDADIIHISPSHHFPTGIVMPIGRRQELLKWANELPGRFILEDDYDCEFRFSGLPIPSLQSIDSEGRVIYLNTFSKSLTPSIRISYLVLPPELLKQYRAKLGFYSCTVSNFEQYTLAAFLSEGYFEKHINRMRNHYRNKRNRMIEAIKNNPISEITTILEEDSGLHFLVRFKTELSDYEVIEKAKEAGIKLSCLSDYSYYNNMFFTHMFIINYSGVPEDHMDEAVSRLWKILQP